MKKNHSNQLTKPIQYIYMTVVVHSFDMFELSIMSFKYGVSLFEFPDRYCCDFTFNEVLFMSSIYTFKQLS